MHGTKETPRPTIGQLALWGKGSTAASEALLKKTIGNLWSDSRKITPGDIFVAVETENDDGHKYVSAALKAGAIAAIVQKRKFGEYSASEQKRLIAVTDTVKALQKMGAAYRKEMGILFVGITGSNGKTTTRSFLASILSRSIPVGETYTNWNNHLGVPMSILRFNGKEWVGVIEMGANHLHEIRTLTKVARPDIAIITNIGYAHVGLFGSLEGTTRAKFEIAEGVPKDGFLLLNGDDHRLVAHAKETGKRCFFFGTSSRCDIRAEKIFLTKDLHTRFVVDGVTYELPVAGRHFVYSVLPSIFLARRFGIEEGEIVDAVAHLEAAAMRGGIEKVGGKTLIVDCYNANPTSMGHAVDLLQEIGTKGHRVAVVGDMLELEQYATRLHRQLGKQLVAAGVDRVVAVGEFAETVKKGMGAASSRAVAVKNAVEAAEVVKSLVKKGDTVLIKGSRGIHLETVWERLKKQ